jgi:hypothetical protein
LQSLIKIRLLICIHCLPNIIRQRRLAREGSAIAKALDYRLKSWAALSRYLDDGAVPIDRRGCLTLSVYRLRQV